MLTFDQLEECEELPKGLSGCISEHKGKETTTALNIPRKTILACKNINMLCQNTVVLVSKTQHEHLLKYGKYDYKVKTV